MTLKSKIKLLVRVANVVDVRAKGAHAIVIYSDGGQGGQDEALEAKPAVVVALRDLFVRRLPVPVVLVARVLLGELVATRVAQRNFLLKKIKSKTFNIDNRLTLMHSRPFTL